MLNPKDIKQLIEDGFTRQYEIWAVNSKGELAWRTIHHWSTLPEALQGWADFHETFDTDLYRLVETIMYHRIITPDEINHIREELEGGLIP